MRIVLNNTELKTQVASSVTVTRSMSDPVPTCSLTMVDQNSTLSLPDLAELLILDDRLIPYPTINHVPHSDLNPYTGNWNVASNTGITLSQPGGGGVSITVNNAPVADTWCVSQTVFATTLASAGQSFTCSFTIQGSSSPTNVGAYVAVAWATYTGAVITQNFFGSVPASTSATRSSYTITAPTNVASATIFLGVRITNAANSGTVTFTQVQIEPKWFSDLSYPTPYCGPNQTNCRFMTANNVYIRQYRKFAGHVVRRSNSNYRGNTRDVTLSAVGYAWIFGSIFTNKSYTNQYDSAMIADLNTTYLLGLFDTTNVVQGVQLASYQANWDYLRDVFDAFASQSGYYWTADDYWNMIYAPPGYITMPISLICDQSATPDNVSTFPAYDFTSDEDFTQPGNGVLVIGSGSNVAQVVDPNSMFLNMFQWSGGFYYSNLSYFMRKINESSLQSNTDCVNRGIAEILQYNQSRNLYHLSTNVELIPGQGIRVTSSTEGLSATTLLIQSVTASWLGTDETLHDTWKYDASLGAVNRDVTNILSRLARQSNQNSSAPAIAQTALVVVERLGMADSASTTTATTGYVQTIQADGPLAYYRLNELSGTIADDFSGHAQAGTLNGGITLGSTGLLTSGGDTAMTFNGSTGYIQLANTGTWPTGNSAWSLECWCKPANSTNAANGHLITIGNPGTNAAVGAICQTGTGGWGMVTWGGAGHDFQGNGTSTAGTIYYVVATYDGASNLDLYVGASGTVTHYGPFNPGTLNLSASHQSIGDSWNGSSQQLFFNGVIDEATIYGYKLTSTQVSNHYTVGTT